VNRYCPVENKTFNFAQFARKRKFDRKEAVADFPFRAATPGKERHVEPYHIIGLNRSSLHPQKPAFTLEEHRHAPNTFNPREFRHEEPRDHFCCHAFLVFGSSRNANFKWGWRF
jgi:hypothetical protein